MNKYSITYYFSLIAIIMTSSSLYAMEQKKQLKFSHVEKQLLSREIDTYGKDILREEINEKREIKFKYNQELRQFGTSRPLILKIQATFYKTDTEIDPLTKSIFDEIERREKNHAIRVAQAPFKQQPQTNKLGNRTKYRWLKENDKTAVEVTSRFKYFGYDQRALVDFVDNYTLQ